MTARLTTLLVGALTMAILAGGCGDEDSSGSEISTSSLDKAAFVKKANAMCGRARVQALAFIRPDTGGQAGSELIAEGIEENIVPAFRQAVSEIHDLGAPRGDEAQVEAFLDAWTDGIDQLEESPPSRLEGIAGPFGRSGNLARQYGLASCAFSR